MKEKRGHLQYHWIKYVAVLLIPLILWCSVFSVMKKPKANERLHILFLGEGLHTEKMEQSLREYLQNHLDRNLKSVQVTQSLYTDQNYSAQLLAATYSYDLIVISESQKKDNVGQGYFSVLPQELQMQTEGLYAEDVEGKRMVFGGVLSENGGKNRFSQYYSGKERCYLFISPQTENLYPYNQNSKQGDQAAVIAWQWFME